jgi:membrane associated rhomboid family serine protease
MSTGSPSSFSVTPVVRALIITCVALWLLTIGVSEMGIDLTHLLGLFNFDSPFFRPWQLFTHLFMHDTKEPFHLFFNMLGLWMFGSSLERYWGPKRFLAYFLITGIGAGVVQTTVTNYQLRPMLIEANSYEITPTYEAFDQFVGQYLPGSFDNEQVNQFLKEWYYDRDNPGYINDSRQLVSEIASMRQNIVNVGASGGLYGLLLAFGMIFPNVMIMMLIPPIPMKAKYFVIVFGAIELFSGLRNNVDDNVAHFAHLGGMLFGIILILIWKKQDRNRNVFRQ